MVSMVTSIEVRKVTQDVLLFVWFNHSALVPEPPRESGLIRDISEEFMHNLSSSVFIESFRTQFIWDDFFKNHFQRMTSSSELFSKYVTYVCYILNDSKNVYESFFDILSIVSEFSLRCLEGNRKEYLNTCVDLFCTFFDKELHQKFKKKKGDWRKFNEYIRKQYQSIQSKSEMINLGDSPVFIFEYFPKALERSYVLKYLSWMGIVKMKKQPYYVVNGIVLKNITQNEVETHEKVVIFATSIETKLKELVQNTFEQLIEDFKTTYDQLISNETKCNEIVIGRKEGRKKEECSLSEIQHIPGGMQSKVVLRKTQSSDIKNQVEKCSSVNDKPSNGMQSKRVVQNTAQKSYESLKNKVEHFSRRDQNTPYRMQNKGMLQIKDQESSDGMKNRSSRRDRKPVGMQSKGSVQKKDQESSDGMKNHSSRRDRKPDGIQSKGSVQKKDQESSDGMKNCSSRTDRKPVGMQSKEEVQKKCQESPNKKQRKGTIQKKGQESSDGIQSKGPLKENCQESSDRTKSKDRWNLVPNHKNKKQKKEGSSKKVQHSPDRIQSNEVLPEKDQESDEIQSKGVLQEKDQESSEGMQSKKAPQKKGQESSDEILIRETLQEKDQESYGMKTKDEWNEEQPSSKKRLKEDCHSPKVQRSPKELQNKVTLQEKYQESSDGTENQVKQCSLNDKKTFAIVSSKTEVTKTELKNKTVADRVSTQSLNAINLRNHEAPAQGSHLQIKSTTIKRVKKLLGDLSLSFENFSELIHSECGKYGVQVPEQLKLKF